MDGTAQATYTLLPKEGPPYNRIAIASFGQVDTIITGVWGYTNDTETAGALAAEISSTTATVCDVNGAGSAARSPFRTSGAVA